MKHIIQKKGSYFVYYPGILQGIEVRYSNGKLKSILNFSNTIIKVENLNVGDYIVYPKRFQGIFKIYIDGVGSGGGGTSPVTSVNSKEGDVVLKSGDIGLTTPINSKTNIQDILVDLDGRESDTTGLLKSDGTVTMDSGYTPTEDTDIATKNYVDSRSVDLSDYINNSTLTTKLNNYVTKTTFSSTLNTTLSLFLKTDNLYTSLRSLLVSGDNIDITSDNANRKLIINSTATGGGGTTYTGGNGIDITNNVISTKITGGDVIAVSTNPVTNGTLLGFRIDDTATKGNVDITTSSEGLSANVDLEGYIKDTDALYSAESITYEKFTTSADEFPTAVGVPLTVGEFTNFTKALFKNNTEARGNIFTYFNYNDAEEVLILKEEYQNKPLVLDFILKTNYTLLSGSGGDIDVQLQEDDVAVATLTKLSTIGDVNKNQLQFSLSYTKAPNRALGKFKLGIYAYGNPTVIDKDSNLNLFVRGALADNVSVLTVLPTFDDLYTNVKDYLVAGSNIDIISDNINKKLTINSTATGGGTTYTAGDGIDITNNVISTKITGGDVIKVGVNPVSKGLLLGFNINTTPTKGNVTFTTTPDGLAGDVNLDGVLAYKDTTATDFNDSSLDGALYSLSQGQSNTMLNSPAGNMPMTLINFVNKVDLTANFFAYQVAIGKTTNTNKTNVFIRRFSNTAGINGDPATRIYDSWVRMLTEPDLVPAMTSAINDTNNTDLRSAISSLGGGGGGATLIGEVYNPPSNEFINVYFRTSIPPSPFYNYFTVNKDGLYMGTNNTVDLTENRFANDSGYILLNQNSGGALYLKFSTSNNTWYTAMYDHFGNFLLRKDKSDGTSKVINNGKLLTQKNIVAGNGITVTTTLEEEGLKPVVTISTLDSNKTGSGLKNLWVNAVFPDTVNPVNVALLPLVREFMVEIDGSEPEYSVILPDFSKATTRYTYEGVDISLFDAFNNEGGFNEPDYQGLSDDEKVSLIMEADTITIKNQPKKTNAKNLVVKVPVGFKILNQDREEVDTYIILNGATERLQYVVNEKNNLGQIVPKSFRVI